MTKYNFNFNDTSTTFSGLVSGDTITFSPEFNFENFSFLEDGDDLLIYADNGSVLRLTDQLLSDALVDTLYFNDGKSIPLYVDNYFYGSTNNATISGASSHDYIYGGNGNNTINGNDGNDIIYGGAGDDVINGGFGGDTIYGGEGNDTLYSDIISGPEPMNTSYTDILNGGAGDDFLHRRDLG